MPQRRSTLLVIAALGLACLFARPTPAHPADAKPYTTITTAELKALLDSGSQDFQVVDTRNPEEYQDTHIPGAINIPQKSFDGSISLLSANKSHRLVFYCNGFT